jgi:hypothetical protein
MMAKKKPRRIAGLFISGFAAYFFFFAAFFFAGAFFFAVGITDSPPILISLHDYCSPLPGKLSLKIFLSHVT